MHFVRRAPLIISLAYLALAISWILLSDWSTALLVQGAEQFKYVSSIKGALFVVITSIFLYVLTRRLFSRQSAIEDDVRKAGSMYRALFETGPDAVLLANHETGKILDCNRASCGLYGYEKDELLQLYISDLTAKLEDSMATTSATEMSQNVSYHLRKDGSFFPASISTNTLPEGEGGMLLISIRDVKPQLDSERILLAQRNLNASLSSSSDLNKTLSLVAKSILSFEDIDICDIALLERKSQQISMFINETSTTCDAIKAVLDAKKYFEKAPYLPCYIDSGELNDYFKENDDSEEIRSCAILPLLQGNEVYAFIFAASRQVDKFSVSLKQALESISQEVCEVVYRISVYDTLLENRQNLQNLFDTVDDYIFIIALDGSILQVNPAVEKRLGYTLEELQSMQSINLFPPEVREEAKGIFKAIIEGTRTTCPMPLVSKDGERLPVDTRAYVRMWSNNKVVLLVSRDISARIQMEAKMQHANRLYAFLSHINQAIVRSHEIDQLLREIVGIAKDQGGFMFAWIGLVGVFNRQHHVVFDTLNINCHPSNPEIVAIDSSDSVVQSGQHVVNNDILSDQRFESWFTAISKCEIRSSGSFPLKKHGKVVGSLNLFSGERNFFDMSEVSLLGKITDSISYALEYLEHEQLRKVAEDGLRASEITYRTIFESVNDAIFVLERNTGALLDVNRQVSDMFGYSPQELMESGGNRWFEKISINEEPYAWDNAKALLVETQKGKPLVFDWVARRKNGTVFNLEMSIRAASISGNDVILAVVRDITVRVRAKDALEKAIIKVSEEKAKTEAIIAAISDGISVSDKDFRVVYQNQVLKDMVGDFVGLHCYEAYENRLTLCDDCPHVRTFKDGRVHRKERSLTKNGKTYYFDITASPIRDAEGNITACLEIVRDVTVHRQAEERVSESEKKFRTLFNHAADGIYIHDLDGRILDANLAAAQTLGYEPNELRNISLKQINTPEYSVRVNDRIAQLVQRGYLVFETKYTAKDGRAIPMEISARVIHIGEDTCILSFARDITERKKAEIALKESEEKFRSIFEDSKDTICILTPDGLIEDINPAGVILFGYDSRDELVGLNIVNDNMITPASDWPKLVAAFKRTGFVKDFELHISRRDAILLTVKLTATALKSGQGDVASVRGIIRDVTQEKIVERQLQQSQKMEAVGQFAGGVAHDFNNIFTSILGYSEIIREKVVKEGPPTLRPFVEHIINSTVRASDLTTSLMMFSRRQTIKPEVIDLNTIIKNTSVLFQRVVREDIEIQVHLEPELKRTVADIGQIEQVLMNLINNSVDAMPKGGLLKIETESIYLDSQFVQAKGYGRPGEYVLLRVSDTGHGMDSKTLERIFEPFFTTKDVGKGTGLGMSIVYGIVKQHDGYINIYSEKGQGTVSTIYLPIIDSEQPDNAVTSCPYVVGGTETILIVEDDPAPRIVSCAALREHGYTVIEAVDGVDAINKYYEHQEAIDFLLLDVVMPKMNGKEVYDQLNKKRPGIKSLFVSGYTGDILSERGILEEGLNFIAKPYSTKVLLQTIRAILDRQN